MSRLVWNALRVLMTLAALIAHPKVALAARDLPTIAYDIMRKDLSEEQWKGYVKKALARYEEWGEENNGRDIKVFLDDRLLQYGVAARTGKIESLKTFVHFLALYKEWREPPPKYIRDVADKNRQDLDNLLAEFTWEKASELTKKKVKEYDREKAEKK